MVRDKQVSDTNINDACCPACYRNGEKAERERIIKLLEVEAGDADSNAVFWVPLMRCIALIKGEEREK